jgi:hypothetical protein
MMFNKKKSIAALAFILTLATFSIAYAAHTTINTTDGFVDANWSSVTVFRNDGDDIGDNNYDINQAWIANTSDNSAFYFRVSLVGSGQLPHDYSSFEARLDCNQNSNYFDSADVIVYYAIDGTTEEIVECQGDEYPQCDFTQVPNNSDANPASFGEEISSTPHNYEWRADPYNGDTDWSQCFGQINGQFTSYTGGFILQDSTVTGVYNTPTAVKMTGFTAKPGKQYLFTIGATGLFFGVIGILGVKISRKRSNPT